MTQESSPQISSVSEKYLACPHGVMISIYHVTLQYVFFVLSNVTHVCTLQYVFFVLSNVTHVYNASVSADSCYFASSVFKLHASQAVPETGPRP